LKKEGVVSGPAPTGLDRRFAGSGVELPPVDSSITVIAVLGHAAVWRSVKVF
jgi:hypothetical protein